MKDDSIKKVLLLGSGALKIGEAGEFDNNEIKLHEKDKAELILTEKLEETKKSIYIRFFEWRNANVSDKVFFVILALIIGFFSAVAAYVLHGLIQDRKSVV